MVSGPRDSRDLGKGLAAQAMTDLPEHGSRGVRELQSPIQLALQDAVFRGQIFVSRQQLLIHRPGHVGKDARPIHNGRVCTENSIRVDDVIESPKLT
jgi:hypothetical protein